MMASGDVEPGSSSTEFRKGFVNRTLNQQIVYIPSATYAEARRVEDKVEPVAPEDCEQYTNLALEVLQSSALPGSVRKRRTKKPFDYSCG